jgi:hypothetical protein
MSSQGAGATGTVSYISGLSGTGGTGCFTDLTNEIPNGYAFNINVLRDGSDWTSYKKKLLIRNENKAKPFQDPWFARGNDYRLQFLQGKFIRGPSGCSTCPGAAFDGNGPTWPPSS